MSLRIHMLFLVGIPFLILFCLGVGRAWQRGSASIQEGEQARLLAIASTLAESLDGDRIQELDQTLVEMDAIKLWADAPPAVTELRQHLVSVAELNDVKSPIYVLAPRPGERDAIHQAPESVHPEGMWFGVTTASTPYWHHPYQYRPTMGGTLIEGQSVATGTYQDEHGTWISAYAPIRSENGEVVALLEVDEKVGVLFERFAGQMLVDISWLSGAFLLVAGLFVVLYRPTSQSLAKLEDVALKLSTGHLDEPLIPTGSREVRTVIRAFDRSRRALLEREARLEEHRDVVEKISKAKSEFLMTISHELRTPLTAIQGINYLLATEARMLTPDETSIFTGATERLRGVVDHILIFVAIKDQTIVLNPAEVDITEIRRAMDQRHSGDCNRRDVHLDWSLGTLDGGRILADGLRIKQALQPLIENAIQFSPKGGAVEVRMQQEPDGLRIDVTDHGPGMDINRIEELCQPFVQADSGDRREHEGTGLGLAISSGLTAVLDGSLAFDTRLGEGCTASLVVPVEIVAALPQAPAVPASPFKAKRVLLVEDNQASQKIAFHFLNKEGWQVAVASNGQEGVDAWLADTSSFAIVLMDIQMPVLDGIAATRAIRSHEGEGRDVVIIALTADGREETRQLAYDAGVDAYMAKPFAWPELFASMAEFEAKAA